MVLCSASTRSPRIRALIFGGEDRVRLTSLAVVPDEARAGARLVVAQPPVAAIHLALVPARTLPVSARCRHIPAVGLVHRRSRVIARGAPLWGQHNHGEAERWPGPGQMHIDTHEIVRDNQQPNCHREQHLLIEQSYPNHSGSCLWPAPSPTGHEESHRQP